jgi:hypothetical protein
VHPEQEEACEDMPDPDWWAVQKKVKGSDRMPIRFIREKSWGI